MSRQMRTVLILAAISLLAVVALGGMAQRYSKILQRDQPAAVEESVADRLVERFARVRVTLRESVDQGLFEGMDPDAQQLAFAAERERAFVLHGMREPDYHILRGLYRRWVTAPARLDPDWKVVLDRHAPALRGCDLGDWETLDR